MSNGVEAEMRAERVSIEGRITDQRRKYKQIRMKKNHTKRMISFNDKMIYDELERGGSEPVNRKAHMVEAKVAPTRVEVKSVEAEAKPRKLKKVYMDSLVVGFSRLDFK